MTRIRVAAVVLASLLAVTSVAVVGQSKTVPNRGDEILAYSARANWLADTYESVSVLRDRASRSLRQMGFTVEEQNDSGLKATRRDSLLDTGLQAGGSECVVTCDIARDPKTDLITHRVSFTAEARYVCHIGKHPYSGVNSVRERLELAQSNIARAISIKPVAELQLVDADSLRQFEGMRITLKGRTEHRKDGVFMVANGVEVQLPNDARERFTNDTEQDIEWTGTLRLAYESHWYKDPIEDLKPGEPLSQSRASHQTPVRFRLDP